MKRRHPPAHYLSIAREIRNIAQEISDPKAQQNMEAVAADYERMAAEAVEEQDAADDSPSQ